MNNIELICLFVRCLRYDKSRRKGAAELPTSVEILCGTTASELLHNSVRFTLCGATTAQLHNSVDLPCGTTAAELNNPVSLMHAPGVPHIFQRQWRTMLKIWRLNSKVKFYSGCWTLWKIQQTPEKHRSMHALRRQIAKMNCAKDTWITMWVSSSKWGKT